MSQKKKPARETPCDTKGIHSAHVYGSKRPFKWCPGVYGPHIDHEPKQVGGACATRGCSDVAGHSGLCSNDPQWPGIHDDISLYVKGGSK